jgi:epoxyqueuosine reductase
MGPPDALLYWAERGLTLQAVMAVSALPADVLCGLTPEQQRYAQLVLLGHVGGAVWPQVLSEAPDSAHPIDAAVQRWVARGMGAHAPGVAWECVYPGDTALSLIRLGECAGWHHPSPFWQGVDAEWGSWFAYRAVLLANTDWPLTPRRELRSPCLDCVGKPCVAACPAQALGVDQALGLRRCREHRLQTASSCEERCLARLACPVGTEHRYSADQLQHHYRHSLAAIRAWRADASASPLSGTGS